MIVQSQRDAVLEFIRVNGPVSVDTIKTNLDIKERNAVEQILLRELNGGKLELSPQGVKWRD